jgi:hypothetical protein
MSNCCDGFEQHGGMFAPNGRRRCHDLSTRRTSGGEAPAVGHQALQQITRGRPGECPCVAVQVGLIVVARVEGEGGEIRTRRVTQRAYDLPEAEHAGEDLRRHAELVPELRDEVALTPADLLYDAVHADAAGCSDDALPPAANSGGTGALEHILRVIGNGDLRHDTMTKDVGRVKVYGDVAVVTARGWNTGAFKGQPISADEWVTDVYRKVGGRWRCVLTHLTPVAAR